MNRELMALRCVQSVLPPTLRLDPARVRLHGSRSAGAARLLRRLVLGLSRGRAIALGNHVFLPARGERDPAVLAHELTHCAQYQTWGPWRYYRRGAAAQLHDLLHRTLGLCASPYAYLADEGELLECYGMEQQAQIVEDKVRSAQRA